MKTSTFLANLIVILFCNSITLNIVSQPYKSIFGKQTTQWNELTLSLSSWTCILNPIKDTVIDLKTYKKICYSGQDCPTVDYTVFIREDSTTGKVWGYEFYNNQERLIMDLSLNVGDTFRIYPNCIYYDTIAIVDSVYYENSLKKVRLNIFIDIGYYEKLTFIEGLGTNFGIDYQINPNAFDFLSNVFLLCSYKDGFLTYKNTFYDTCYLVWLNIDKKTNLQNIKVYPNPAKDVLNIQANDFSNKNVIIYNSLGQIVQSVDFTNDIRLNLNSFKNGIYLLKILDNKTNLISNIKFIKN